MTSKQSNKDKEIINKTLIVSYFLIFTLVFMMLFLIKELFFTYTADEAYRFEDYTGSIHVGQDTTAGDYYIQNAKVSTSDMVYGVRTSEKADFTVIPYTENQIIQIKNGEHIILYKSNLIPVETAADTEVIKSSISDEGVFITNDGEETSTSVSGSEEGMIKLSNNYYNTSYVLSVTDDGAYYELYDQELNVLDHRDLAEQTLVSLSPQDASYIRFYNLTVKPIDDYKPAGRLESTYFTAGVYLIGKNLEEGNFQLLPENEECSYRVIDSNDAVASTPLQSCTDLPIIFELSAGQILEVHNATLERYLGEI